MLTGQELLITEDLGLPHSDGVLYLELGLPVALKVVEWILKRLRLSGRA